MGPFPCGAPGSSTRQTFSPERRGHTKKIEVERHMAAKQRNEILVGGFIFAALGLLVLLLFLMGTITRLITPVARIQVVFADIRGLKPSDPVSFLGSKVGQVTSVEFVRKPWDRELPALFRDDPGEITRVLITLEVDRKILPFLRNDSPVEIDKNLTGNLNVLIREGKGTPLAVEGAILRGSPGTDLATIADRIDAMLRKTEPVIDDLVGFTRKFTGSDDLDRAVKDVALLARELREGLGQIPDKLTDTLQEIQAILGENRGDIRTVATNLAASTAVAQKILERIDPAVGDLRAALAQVEKVGATVSKAVAENRPGIDAIIEETRSAVANAANLTADVRRRPWRLLYKPSKDETEGLDLYDAAWAYNLGAAALQRSLEVLSERMGSDPQGDRSPEAVQTACKQVEESLRRHREAEEAFWGRLKAH